MRQASIVCLSGLSGILAATAASLAAAANPVFDAVVHSLHAAPFALDNNGAPKAYWNASASVFREGDPVGLACNAGGPPVNKDDMYENFRIFFFVDGKLLKSLTRLENAAHSDPAIWTATGVGTHALECRVDAKAPGDKANDSASVAVVVKPKVAGEPGVMYYGAFGSTEGPKVTAPKQGERYTLQPDMTIDVIAAVPGGAYTTGWAQQTPYDERWHIDVVRRGSGPNSAAEALVMRDTGALTTPKFGTTLGEWFVKNGGVGRYAARIYFSQQRPDGYFESASSRIEFEVTERTTDERSNRPPAVAAAARALGGTARPDTGRVFAPPLLENRRVDTCLHWGRDCGQPAADAFCANRGYAAAVEFVVASDIGAQTPTLVVGDGKVCAEAFCDGFAMIRCAY